MRIAGLHFEHEILNAQVAIDSTGLVAGLLFVPAKPEQSPDAQKLADQRVNAMLAAIRDGRFDTAEEHFDAAMKSGLPPTSLEESWAQHAGALGAIKA